MAVPLRQGSGAALAQDTNLEKLGGFTGLHVVCLHAHDEGAFAAFGVVGGRSRIEEVGH